MPVRGSGLAGALCRIHLGKRTASWGGGEGEGYGEGEERRTIVIKKGFGPAETRGNKEQAYGQVADEVECVVVLGGLLLVRHDGLGPRKGVVGQADAVAVAYGKAFDVCAS